MFRPKYTITDRVLNNISQIMAGREVIERSNLIPKWELSLRKEARVHNAHYEVARISVQLLGYVIG